MNGRKEKLHHVLKNFLTERHLPSIGVKFFSINSINHKLYIVLEIPLRKKFLKEIYDENEKEFAGD